MECRRPVFRRVQQVVETVSISLLNALPISEYVQTLDSLYEYSPWVVERSAELRPFPTKKAMQASMESVIFGAGFEEQKSLLSAHPDLAAKLEEIASLTDFSRAEQSRAGFANLSEADLIKLRSTLALYREKFSHPFILCVSEHQAEETLPILLSRLQANEASELIACLAQVARIGWYRLNQLVTD